MSHIFDIKSVLILTYHFHEPIMVRQGTGKPRILPYHFGSLGEMLLFFLFSWICDYMNPALCGVVPGWIDWWHWIFLILLEPLFWTTTKNHLSKISNKARFRRAWLALPVWVVGDDAGFSSVWNIITAPEVAMEYKPSQILIWSVQWSLMFQITWSCYQRGAEVLGIVRYCSFIVPDSQVGKAALGPMFWRAPRHLNSAVSQMQGRECTEPSLLRML